MWPAIAPETADRLVRAATILEASQGTIMSEAERPSRVGVVLSGAFVATWSAPDGRIVYVGIYGPGQFLGVASLSGAPNVIGVEVITPVKILCWNSGEFREIAESDPKLALDLLDRAIYAVQALNHLIKVRAFTTSASRLAGLLLQYEAMFFSGDTPLVPRRRLPALAGVTPEMVTRILRGWEAAGILRRVGASGLKLIDRAALEAEAASFRDFPGPDTTIRGAWSPPRP
jgi:CRP-like cAMP-binding protein